MKSLRARLLLGTTIGTTVVLLASGILLHAFIRRTLWAEFDEALLAKARSLAALADEDEEGLDFDVAEVSLPEFAASARPEYYQLWLQDGSVLARSPSLGDQSLDRPAGTRDVPEFEAASLPDGRTGRIVSIVFVPRQEFSTASAPIAKSATLVVGRDTADLEGTLARYCRILFGVGLAAVAMTAGVLAWVVGRGLRPIQTMCGQIARVGENDLSLRIAPGRNTTELSPIVERLNELLARLEAAFERERRFTGDVAHELRTPLAGLRAQLELALSRERSIVEYRKVLSECLGIDLHMQRMVENLLHLARADAGQFEARSQRVDVSQLIRDCWSQLEEKAKRRQLAVDWRIGEPNAVETDPEKLRLVFQNVLDNAVTYADQGGRVSLSAVAVNGTVIIEVRNSGCCLSEDQVAHVFDRFWRADASHHANEGPHCGLGLPLCRAMMQGLGGSIDARSTAEGMFSITLQLRHHKASGCS